MLERIAAGITDNWIKNKIINVCDKEIYEYGIILSLEHMASLVTTALIAVLTGEMFVCMAFYISFANLRSYMGGFHAKSFLRCYVYSTAIILVSLLMIRFDVVSIYWYRVMCVLATIYLMKTQPIDSENKRVEDNEKEIFRVRKNKILIFMYAIILTCIGLNFLNLEKALESAVIVVFLCCVLCREILEIS